MIELGSIVKDKITRFTGIAMSSTTWLFGCVRIHVEPQELHDGKPIAMQVFDEQRLEIVGPIPAKLACAMPIVMSHVVLGSLVRDMVTGFTGVVVGTSTWLGGPARVGVEARQLNKDCKPLEGQWFEQGRIEVLEGPSVAYVPSDGAWIPVIPSPQSEDAVPPLIAQEPKKTGGPQPDPRPASRDVFSAGGE